MYNDSEAVVLTDNAFITAASGFYSVIVTATDEEDNSASTALTLVVDGTYLYSFDNLTNPSDTWGVASGSANRRIDTDENGDKSWKFEANAYEIVMNMPLYNFDTANIVDGDPVTVSFTVELKTDPEFKSDGITRLDTILINSKSANTTVALLLLLTKCTIIKPVTQDLWLKVVKKVGKRSLQKSNILALTHT